MMNSEISRHLIASDRPLRSALEALNRLSGDVMVLMVTDGDRLVGTLTDGDVRRSLLRGVKLDDPVSMAMHTSFRRLQKDHIDVELLRSYRREGIALIPVVDADGRIDRLVDTRITSTILPLSAILMAGGKGERLRPLTLECPKPLLKVGEKAIIDYNIGALARAGITDITVMTNYLAPMIEEHFASPFEGVPVKCVREDRFLGTIGAASLVPHAKGGNTLVMNSDLLTSISFEEMYLTHKREEADITIAAVPYNVAVPYAILTTDGQRVTALAEKPNYSYYANAGIYIFSNDVLDSLRSDERTDATDLIERSLSEGRKVVYYPLRGTWIDIGSPTDYAHACELMNVETLKH